MSSKVEIKNKRARFEFEFVETFTAGVQLFGTEIKSIRMHLDEYELQYHEYEITFGREPIFPYKSVVSDGVTVEIFSSKKSMKSRDSWVSVCLI